MATDRLKLYALSGSSDHDLASLDPASLVAASYLQLLVPGEWDLIECSDPGLSPSGALPFLKHGLETYTGSAILHHLEQLRQLQSDESSSVANNDSIAFRALLDTSVLPLVLHSLFSLPQNWVFVRSLLIPRLAFPSSYYRPGQLRESAQDAVTALHPDWWGLGGEAEREEALEQKRKRALLDTGVEGLKERREEARKEGKERMKKTFGEGKIVGAARQVFNSLETTLAKSSTPFFFSSPRATPLDAQLSSLLSLLLFLPLPTPLLADLINASFPRLWTHTTLLRRTLWSPESVPLPRRPSSPKISSGALLMSTLRDLIPIPYDLFSRSRITRSGKPVSTSSSEGPRTKSELDFVRKRRMFMAVCAVGVLGWGFGTGALPVPFAGRLGKLLGREFGRGGTFEEEWEEDEEDDEDEDDEEEIDGSD